MYHKRRPANSSLKVNQATEGETIEAKVRRIINNKEGIEDGAPIIFTERSEGVPPEYNIRTDRFELAIEATDKMAKERLSKRQERLQKDKDQTGKEKGNTGGEPAPPEK